MGFNRPYAMKRMPPNQGEHTFPIVQIFLIALPLFIFVIAFGLFFYGMSISLKP